MQVIRLLKTNPFLALGLMACVAEPTEPEEIGLAEASQDIINGTPVNPEGTGWVLVNGNCSGSLRNNDWVLTAKHCGTVVSSYGNTNLTFTGSFQHYLGLTFGSPSPWQVVTGNFQGGSKTGYARLGGTFSYVFVPR